MRTANRLLYLLASFLLGYNWAYSQTQADVRMGEILNSGDLFLLKEEYPNLKDSVSVKMLDFMVEAQLGIGFNKLENAAVALDRGQHIYIPVEVNGATKILPRLPRAQTAHSCSRGNLGRLSREQLGLSLLTGEHGRSAFFGTRPHIGREYGHRTAESFLLKH